MMKAKSMKKNAILTMIKTIISLIVPLITFPYISRILQVDAIGKYNFSSSIVSYFILISELGISTYAIREGAKLRENTIKFNTFASEIFIINVISTITSYILLGISIIIFTKLKNYSVLILILSIQIVFRLWGKSWIYNIYEEFEFITMVQIGFQVISIILLFFMVRSPSDVYKYAIISVISSAGANIFYGIHSNKYMKLEKIKIASLKRHIKPIIIIFGTAVATTIYVNSDMTILGWLVDDKAVGLYSTAVKIYNIIKQVMVAVITVTIPRLTLYAGTEKFKPLFSKVFNVLIVLVIPAIVGLAFVSNNIIEIIAGSEFLAAATSLKWLGGALIFALLACLFGTSVLLPYKKETIFFISTAISAVINIVLNIILIPIFKQNAAAFTTLLSQAVAMLICYYYSKKYISLKESRKTIAKVLIGSIAITVVCILVRMCSFNLYMETIITVIISIIIYAIIQILLKNKTFMEGIYDIKEWTKKR